MSSTRDQQYDRMLQNNQTLPRPVDLADRQAQDSAKARNK